MDSYISNSNGLSSSGQRSSQIHHTMLEKMDYRALGVLMLENTLTRHKVSWLSKQLFITRLKTTHQPDTIDEPEIAPLTRNSEPNESSFSFKKTSGDSLTRAVTTFRQASHTLTNEQLLNLYKQRINEVDRLMLQAHQQKRSVEQRERELITKLKGLRFQSVPTCESGCQTEIKLEQLTRKQTELKRLEIEMRESYIERSQTQEERQSYLKYLEEALVKKQEQLQLRQSELAAIQERLNQEDLRYRTQPLNYLADSKSLYEYFALLKDRIYEAVQQFEQGKEQSLQLLENHPLYQLFDRYEELNAGKDCRLKMQILKLLEVSSLEIRYKLEIAEEYFRREYDKVVELRQALQNKNAKFIELNSYEGYLDRYKKLLDTKEKEVVELRNTFRQEMKGTYELLLSRQEQSERTISNTQSEGLSGIKSQGGKTGNSRNRIFTRPGSHCGNPNNAHSAIAPDDSKSNFDEERKFMSVRVNQMKEEYHKRVELLQNSENPLLGQLRRLQEQNAGLRNKLEQKSVLGVSKLEASHENIDTVLQNAKRKQLLVKFLTQWLGMSFRKNVKNSQLSKTFAFGLWRMRQYDPTIFGKIIELTNESYDPSVQKLWAVKLDKDKKDRLYPYVRSIFMQKSLSLKRKEFMEEFFDLQRKQFFKNRLRTMIRSIVRNKVRKERLVVVVAFHRFLRNCSMVKSCGPKKNLLKEFKQISNNTHSQTTIAPKAAKKSNCNSRTTLQYQSIRTSNVRDRTPSKIINDKENQMRELAEKQRIEMQARVRRTLACSKIFSFTANSHCRLETKVDSLSIQKASAFYRWSILTSAARQQTVLRTLDSKYEQLEFKMNLNNTKQRLAQSGLSSKLELLEELLSIAQP